MAAHDAFGGQDLVEPTPWPIRLWAPRTILFTTGLGPDDIVARLAGQSPDFVARPGRERSKIAYRMELTDHGFKLFKVGGRFLGNPPRIVAVLDATGLG